MAIHLSAEPATMGVELAHPTTAPAPEEGPPASRDAAVVAEAATEDTPTGEGRRGASPAPGAISASPGLVRPAGGREAEAIPSWASLMSHGRMAERLLARVCLPELQAKFSHLGASTILQVAFTMYLWAVNSLSALRDITLRSDNAHQETSVALARAEKAESALEVARGEDEEAKRALGVARREAEKAKMTLGVFQEEVEEVRRQGVADLGRAHAAEAELVKTAAKLRAHRYQLDMVLQEVKDLEGQIENTEEIVRMADARATDADGKVADATARMSKAL